MKLNFKRHVHTLSPRLRTHYQLRRVSVFFAPSSSPPRPPPLRLFYAYFNSVVRGKSGGELNRKPRCPRDREITSSPPSWKSYTFRSRYSFRQHIVSRSLVASLRLILRSGAICRSRRDIDRMEKMEITLLLLMGNQIFSRRITRSNNSPTFETLRQTLHPNVGRERNEN